MANGDLIIEMVVDVPRDEIEKTREDFESQEFTVKVEQQNSGLFAVAAAKSR